MTISMNEACLYEYQLLKNGQHTYVVFTMAGTEYVVEKTSSSTVYDDFLADLPPAECRWAAYSFAYEGADGAQQTKRMLVQWSPDQAPGKQRILFASTADMFYRQFTGIAFQVQATQYDDIAYKTVLDRAKSSA
ncbi:actin depolymerization factor/cofilin-like domain-containing protein [Streptomyces sp. NPDC006339]|uniref:actin-binding ADF family protein n=1 Tax=Streptomyces sp. NPDC006339 TaxID=3156755 RepID=UPI0033A0565E